VTRLDGAAPAADGGPPPLPRARLGGLLAAAALLGPPAMATEAMPHGLYEVTTETVMPHLEANLRYATTRVSRCLGHQELSSAFPILSHAALQDCQLANESRRGDAVSYRLLCAGGHGTTGNAQWQLGADQLTGRLNVKLGGKNMTFYQTVTARALGECDPEAK